MHRVEGITYISGAQPPPPLAYPLAAISIYCNLYISKVFVIKIVAVISDLYVLTVNKQPNNYLSPPLFNFFAYL
jgi:hypothetical protein